MTLNQLRYFRVLARTEHYARAAEELEIAQPSLSRAITLLEEELGVALFCRKGRNVALTDAGRQFLGYAGQALDALDRGVDAMDARCGRAQRVSLGCISPVVNTFVPHLLEGFRRQETINAYYDIRVSQSEPLVAELKNGGYDLVFCSYLPGETEAEFTPVLELPLVVAVRRDDPLAAYAEVRLEQLARRPMVFTDTKAYSGMLRQMLLDAGITPDVRGVSNEDAVLLGMVQAGLGILISTDHPQMYSPDTVLVPLRQNRFRRYVYMVTRPGGQASVTSLAARKLIAYNQRHAIPVYGCQPAPGRAGN